MAKIKGSLILTAALELSSNQITHFYSNSKSSGEMIRLLKVLIDKYVGCRGYISLLGQCVMAFVEESSGEIAMVNKYPYRKKHKTPIVKVAPLPNRAQFLNVIESVFSGMVAAIIQNSNYQSVDEAKSAIDRYFAERNEHFLKYPKKAGGKIWGNELVAPNFKEGQNCKNSRWR